MGEEYGPNSVEVKAFLAKVISMTEEQRDKLAEVWSSISLWLWLSTSMAATSAVTYNVREDAWRAAYNAWVRNLPSFCMFGHSDAMQAMCGALVALIAKDLIEEEDFKMLYGPWASVMEGAFDV